MTIEAVIYLHINPQNITFISRKKTNCYLIKNYPLSITVFYLSLFFLWVSPLKKNETALRYTQFNANSLGVELLKLTTTSTSSVWSPSKVTTGGEILEWRASASGMVDQIIQTSVSPEFDLSVDRASFVTITASTIDGVGNLTELRMNSLNINSLSLDNSLVLSVLSCTDNQLSSLDLQNNTALTNLFCHSNQLSSLNVTLNTNLSILACFSNQIAEIDLSNNLILSNLSCSNNLLTNLDLSNNTQLIALECDFNRLQDLNIQNGNNTLVQKFNTTNNLNLFCIQVDNVEYSNVNWPDIDAWTAFNKDCTFTNEPPVANDDFYKVNENEILQIEASEGVLINDTDPDEDELMAILQQDVEHGRLELLVDGSFEYEPSSGYFGTDSFTYVANDGEFDSNLATVTIEVIMVNEAPIANDKTYSTNENTTLEINAVDGVLSNDVDPDGDPLTAVLSNDSSHGSLILSPDGSFTYSPDFEYYGADSFTYNAFDGYTYSNEAMITINVESVSDIVVPNAFTPNNDGVNDTFRPVYRGMNNVELQIFDTWGNLVYSETGKDLQGWNGIINNKLAENGNYLYRIEAVTNQIKTIKREGIFTLIK